MNNGLGLPNQGFSSVLVVITNIENQMAICYDHFHKAYSVTTALTPGALPQIGEQWYITKQHFGYYTFQFRQSAKPPVAVGSSLSSVAAALQQAGVLDLDVTSGSASGGIEMTGSCYNLTDSPSVADVSSAFIPIA